MNFINMKIFWEFHKVAISIFFELLWMWKNWFYKVFSETIFMKPMNTNEYDR